MSKLWLPRKHPAERLGLERRSFIAGLAAGASALALGACDSRGPQSAMGLLAAATRWNERVERKLFRSSAMNTPAARAHDAGHEFPSYFVSDEVPVWNEAEQGTWRLEIGGLVRRPVKLTLDELKTLPRTELRLEHFLPRFFAVDVFVDRTHRFVVVRIHAARRAAGFDHVDRFE